jgi:metacaspase-1
MSKKALIVAINAYPRPEYVLRSALNDLNDLTTTLIAKGFSITKLTDSAATKSAILSKLNMLITGAVSGDSIVFAFFGHGSWITGNEPDGRTECICPVNVFSGYVITDNEIASKLALKKSGVTCDVILGNCYSGTGTRSPSGSNEYKKEFCIPGPIEVKKIKKMDQEIIKSTVPVSTLNHVLWAACKDNQLSYEVLSEGKYRGLFPLYLCWALRNYPAYSRSQIDLVVAPLVTAIVPTQEIQTEGTQEELDQLPFT